MSTLETRIAALEQTHDKRIEVGRIGADGVARTVSGQVLAPGWERGKDVIVVVRSYGLPP